MPEHCTRYKYYCTLTNKSVYFCLQVTLNMLNAQETEMDTDGLGGDVKLEFESSTEEVTT